MILEKRASDDMLQIHVDKGEEALPTLFSLFANDNVRPLTVQLTRPSLDDVFLKLTGRSLREAETTPS